MVAKAVEFNIPVITNIQLAEDITYALEQLKEKGIVDLESYYEKVTIKSLSEYLELNKFQYYW